MLTPTPFSWSRLTLLAVAVTVLAGCSGDAENTDEPQAPTEPAPTTSRSSPTVEVPALPASPSELRDECLSPTRYPDAAEYTGDGPHPIVVFETAGDNALYNLATEGLPADWTADAADEVQLVACAESVEGDRGIGTCEYTDAYNPTAEAELSVPLYSTDYTIEVQDLRTGGITAELAAEATGAQCPQIFYDSDDPDSAPERVHTSIDIDELIEILDEVVTGPAD